MPFQPLSSEAEQNVFCKNGCQLWCFSNDVSYLTWRAFQDVNKKHTPILNPQIFHKHTPNFTQYSVIFVANLPVGYISKQLIVKMIYHMTHLSDFFFVERPKNLVFISFSLLMLYTFFAIHCDNLLYTPVATFSWTLKFLQYCNFRPFF